MSGGPDPLFNVRIALPLLLVPSFPPQELCGRIEKAQKAFAFSSGMAALGAVLRLLQPGDAVIASSDIYGGMHRLLTYAVKHQGIIVKFVPTWDLARVNQVLVETPNTRMLCVESPTNPLMKVSDIRGLATVAHEHGALLSVDNSIMSPLLSQPLALGADIVIHSATKFLSGHSDVSGGIVAMADLDIANRVGFLQNAEGSGMAPFDVG